MWHSLGKFILKYRLPLLLVLAVATGFMAWHASKVQLSYDFSRAIPINNPKYKAYQEFRKNSVRTGTFLLSAYKPINFLKKNYLMTMPPYNAA